MFFAVFGAQQVLQQHLEAERELVVALDRVDAEDLVVRLADPEGVLRSETVYCRHKHLLFSTGHGDLRRFIFAVELCDTPARLT